MVKPTIVIAAISARSFAQAAVACGYQVITLDAFADADTQAICKQTFKLKLNENLVDETDFKRQFLEMASGLNLAKIDGFLYGSLFDHCPDLLAWVAHRIRLVGNASEVMCLTKSFDFFKLLDDLNIQHPEVCLNEKKPLSSFPRKRESNLTLNLETKKMDSRFRGNDGVGDNWLSKQLGGSGGLHIKSKNCAEAGDYFQQKVAGTPISMLFVADGKTARTIGFNQQFIAPTHEMPYRFAGAVSNIVLQPNIHEAFEHAAQALTSALNLCGLNNLDAILEGENLWILELNPRLSATFCLYNSDLYDNLLPLHFKGCAGSSVEFSLQRNTSKAQLILYADEAFEIPADFAWPSWAADIPALEVGESSVRIARNMPICSVFGQAKSAETAHALAQQRAEKLRETLIK
jgi:predicted ATP-grasp superfamily ATP-dependent carboligase